jgi:putative peptide zinc metalloprotease protein
MKMKLMVVFMRFTPFTLNEDVSKRSFPVLHWCRGQRSLIRFFIREYLPSRRKLLKDNPAPAKKTAGTYFSDYLYRSKSVPSTRVLKGFWGSLSSLTGKVSSRFSGIWRCLKDLVCLPVVKTFNLYATLHDRVKFSSYRPRLRAEIQAFSLTSTREGPYYILKNPMTHAYLKVTPEEHHISSLMDGTKTIEELVVAYFMEFRVLAQDRVAGLVRELWRDSFLQDRPVNLFRSLKEKLEEGSLAFHAKRLQHLFFNYQVSLKGIDGFVTFLYRYFFWIFFSRPLIMLYPLLSLFGLYAFVLIFCDGRYHLFQVGSSYSLGIFTLMAITIFRISLHEGAHAFAAKSYGREIPRGGFLFYFGIPSFFADTTDIWLGSKKERIAVSWAGPYAEIILSSILSIFVVAFPGTPLNGLFYKIAFVGYLSAFLNLNPLLELDGYFMLMDWLEIPLLRKLSMNFISYKLYGKLRSGDKFNPREKIYTLFGSLSLLWTGIAIILSLVLLKIRMLATLRDMFHSDEILARFSAVVTFLLFVAPLLISLIAMVYAGGRKVYDSISRSSILKDQRIQALLLLCLSLAIAFSGEFHLHYPLSIILCVLSCVVIIMILREILGSTLIDEFAMKLAALLSLTGFAVMGGFNEPMDYISRGAHCPAHQVAFSLALLFFFIYALRFSLNFDLSLYSGAEKLRLGLALLVTIMILLALDWSVMSFQGAPSLLSLSWQAIGMLTLLLLVPMLYNHSATSLTLPLLMEACALVLLLIFASIGSLPGMKLSVGIGGLFTGMLSLSLLMGSSILFLLAYRSRKFIRPGAMLIGVDDREKTFAAFKVLGESLVTNFRATFGERSFRRVVRDFNGHSNRERWGITLEGASLVAGNEESDMPEPDARCRGAIDCLRRLAIETAGKSIVQHALMQIYDGLYWEERELANEHFLTGLPWADFVRAPRFREEVVSLLRSSTLLGALDDEELRSLVPILKVRNFCAGDTIVLQGEPGDAFYIIRQGRARVVLKDDDGNEKMIATLRRGDSFGERALIQKCNRTATVKALTSLEVLLIGKNDFDRLFKDRHDLLKGIRDACEMEGLLGNLPLFTELSNLQLQVLYSRMASRKCAAAETIIRQGDEGEEFFIIRKGEFSVAIARDEEDGLERVMKGVMKEGEYFGEIALIKNIPRTATVTALTEGELLVLCKNDFQELLKECHALGRSLERSSSRRISSDAWKHHGGKSASM